MASGVSCVFVVRVFAGIFSFISNTLHGEKKISFINPSRPIYPSRTLQIEHIPYNKDNNNNNNMDTRKETTVQPHIYPKMVMIMNDIK